MAAGVQSMCQYWKEFNLPELQRTLDTTATEIANKQDESDASRKKLVELSRDFKKNTPEDLRKLVAPLLKNFQLEVDALSKRSKSSEAAFLSVYKRIIDLPDPVSALEHALHIQKRAQRVSDLEIENKQLRETLEEYNNEFAEVKNQEVTIKQLKEKIKDCEEKIEGTAEARTKEKERELQRLFAEKERQLQETQLSVAKKLGEAEQKISILQSSLDHVQQELFDVRSKYDETSTAKSDEMDMVIADLERANERATSAEREAERLKAELTKREEGGKLKSEAVSKTTEEQAMDILQRSSLEVELAAKEKEIAQLVEDVQRLQASLNKLRESTANQVSKLEEELNMKNQAFRLLEQKIKNQEDYEEIKRELSVMKSIEFSKSGDESNGDMQKKSLEMLLLEKNKALQSENTTLKLAKQDLSGKDTPALSESAENFASMLGEEIAASYQQKQQSETNASSRRSTPSTTSSIANDSEKMSSPKRSVERSHSIPPMSSDIHLPPPSPHFFPFPNGPFSAAVNGPLMASYAGLSAVKSETSSSQGLDTSLVAKTVRELLSIHNIGQRLFAKHVLGLSQGTVSELLSKPKSWDKLTEKGRESYRKMYQWATDERNILSLKAISPKKNTQHVMPNITREDSQTEERIAQILSEAQQAMQIKKEVEQVSSLENYHQVASAMASSIYQQEMARLAIVSSHQKHLRSPTSLPSPHHIHSASINAHRRSSHNDRHMADNQMSNKEMVERIYKQELMKLAKAAESAGNVAALSMYQQELSKMSQPSKDDHEPGEITRNTRLPENLSVKKEPAESPMEDLHQSNGPIDLSKHGNSVSAPTTPTSAISDKSPTDSTQPASAFFRPKSAIPENGMESPRFGSYNNNSECISPLQRMQSIANSVMSRPHPGLASNKPLRAVLPPITQEQFDKYANMCTEELVKKVKETLSQYSISQRLFGENVLGLSQGSVSDLLARPKPWQMLTQKGREPFIRMQIFLEDTEAVPKLVASQYHIPPDKLMRNNGNLPNQETGEKAGSCSSSSASAVGGPSVASSHMTSENALQHMSHLHHHHLHPSQPHQAHNPLLSAHHYNWATFSYPSSMLEVVAMTSEIDTLELTSRVKDVLQFHNLGQKLFGEAVLGLSQGSVSELLSKPKPWHMLSIKGREPFIKMHLWLSDPHNVERLKHYQNEVKAQRRRRSSVDERPYDAVSQPKRPRVFFNEEQKEKLKMAYHQDPYPNQSTIEALANQLNVGVKTVINWFHNHRMRAKQQQHSGNSSGGGSTSSFNEFNSNVVKSEPADDSNQSDLSSLSGDVPNYPAGSQYNESGQWLFPTFKKVSSNDKRGSGSDEREFEDMDDEDEGRSEQSFSPVPFEDDKEEEEDEFKKEESLLNGKQDQDSTGEYSDDPGLNNSGRSVAPSQPQIGVNKRKRSNPQYMSEGRQLDKTKTTSYNASVSLDEGVEVDGEDEEDNADLEKENEDMNTRDSNSKVPRVADHLDGLQKIKKVNKSSEEAWEDMDRSSNIAKLQKNLQQQSPNSEWEF